MSYGASLTQSRPRVTEPYEATDLIDDISSSSASSSAATSTPDHTGANPARRSPPTISTSSWRTTLTTKRSFLRSAITSGRQTSIRGSTWSKFRRALISQTIQSAIPNVRAVAVFLSSAGVGKWQALEVRAFVSQCVERDLPVIPVLLPDRTDFPDKLLFLRELSYIRWDPTDSQKSTDFLVWGITGQKPPQRTRTS